MCTFCGDELRWRRCVNLVVKTQASARRHAHDPPRQVSKPLHVGLKVARTAVWAAALTLAAVKVGSLTIPEP